MLAVGLLRVSCDTRSPRLENYQHVATLQNVEFVYKRRSLRRHDAEGYYTRGSNVDVNNVTCYRAGRRGPFTDGTNCAENGARGVMMKHPVRTRDNAARSNRNSPRRPRRETETAKAIRSRTSFDTTSVKAPLYSRATGKLAGDRVSQPSKDSWPEGGIPYTQSKAESPIHCIRASNGTYDGMPLETAVVCNGQFDGGCSLVEVTLPANRLSRSKTNHEVINTDDNSPTKIAPLSDSLLPTTKTVLTEYGKTVLPDEDTRRRSLASTIPHAIPQALDSRLSSIIRPASYRGEASDLSPLLLGRQLMRMKVRSKHTTNVDL